MERKTEITRTQYHKLLGLMVLAERHDKALQEILEAVKELVGDDEDCGHSMDAVYSDQNVDDLMSRLKITVKDI